MTLQTRLTLWSVLLITLIVSCVSLIDLRNEVQRQFEATLDRARLTTQVTADMVAGALEREPTLSLPEALARDTQISNALIDVLTASRSIVEIAVCDPNNTILLDADGTQVGHKLPVYADFRHFVETAGWSEKAGILFRSGRRNYQLWEPLGEEGREEPLLNVRVVINPGLIRQDVWPAFIDKSLISVISVIGSILVALAFSSVAFRPLGKLSQMLDRLARGEFEHPDARPPSEGSVDEFGIVASKVNLLGQQLRGAKYEFSDLRGNFEKLLDELEDAILLFGRDHRLMIAAGAVEKFLSRSRSDLIGKSLFDIFPPTETLGLLLSQASQNGRRIINRRVAITRNGKGDAFIALLSTDTLDSFETDSAEHAAAFLVRLRDPEPTRQIGRQLQTAERLTAISRITGGVAHEVKNPLNAMQLHLDLAKSKLAKGDYNVNQQFEIISSEIARLDRVVKTFLDFTRPVELQLMEAPLEAFVNETVELARPQASAAGIEISVEQHAPETNICADVDMLKQAILNIVMNAIEAMPSGGSLRFVSRVADEQAEIQISDTGSGIPPEMREKIFRLYYTTKPGGSGIGLAMTYRIIQLHDGTIDFTSEPGKGTTFVLRLPTSSGRC